MKLAAGMVLAGIVSLGSAHAAEQNAVSGGSPQLDKGQAKQAAVQPPGKKAKVQRSRKAKLTAQSADTAKADPAVSPVAKERPDSVQENPLDPAEQSVQLKGVRG